MGHQAANCTNGTVNWRRLYGDDAFRLKPPIYPSDEDKSKKAREVDFKSLEDRAKEWAKVRLPTRSLGMRLTLILKQDPASH